MPPSSPFRADAALAQHSVDLCRALLLHRHPNPRATSARPRTCVPPGCARAGSSR
ncbi:MAG: hypothetical protein IPG81_34185 [Sandaracinaceae bacterium]|nr:hypothetical protein [Sandaracinaceae bacterium]